MEINYNITEEAYLEFNLYHAKNSETMKKSVTTQRVLVPIIYLLLSVFLSYVLDMPVLFLFIPFLIVSVLWAVFYPAYFHRHIRRNAQKLIREGKNEGMLGNRTMIFTEEGLREITSTGEKIQSWPGIEKIGEDSSNFYLYNSGMSAYIVSKRNMADIDGVRSFLHSKIKLKV